MQAQRPPVASEEHMANNDRAPSAESCPSSKATKKVLVQQPSRSVPPIRRPCKPSPLLSSRPTALEICPSDPTALQTLPSVEFLSNSPRDPSLRSHSPANPPLYLRFFAVSQGGTMGAIKLAVVDEVMTFGWVFCASTLRAATMVIASLLGAQPRRLAVGLPGHHHRPRHCLRGHRWSAQRGELQPHRYGVVLRGSLWAVGRNLSESKERAGLGTMNSGGGGGRL
ncbi:hypothetical protein CRG98_019094 [Punica granatum]|uniref:Uncharacterized protein n=1 Tax=Punica granatum TaxID=22663 RepID=A0A2I0JYJ3_PUNGR|nr:hypothetical protein CRG98_019094 [Punica granatum]